MTQRDYDTTTTTGASRTTSASDDTLTRDRSMDRADRDYDSGDNKRFRRVLSAGTLSGDRVRNSAGEDLGKIEEIMLDIPSGRVAYAVLSFGGFLGMGNKLFAVPWNALTLDEREHEFILNVDKQVLENAPGFDKDNWPDMADPTWGSQIFKHYGYTAEWDDRAGLGGAGSTMSTRSGENTRTGGGGL
jgi:sporulation protein YlmC with PRC-barrel domain